MTSPQSGNALMKRLWQRTERPGCLRHGHAQAILARHTRIAARPSLAELLLRRGHSAEYAAQDAPVIVAARSADIWPEPVAHATVPLAVAVPPPPTVPPPAAVPAPAPAPRQTTPEPRATVQARLTRPSDIAPAPPPVPVQPGPSAETSSRAEVLRENNGAVGVVAGRETKASVGTASRESGASIKIEAAGRGAAPPSREGAPRVPAPPPARPVAVVPATPARPVATGPAPGEVTASSRPAPPSRPPTTTTPNTTPKATPASRASARSADGVPAMIVAQSGHYLPNTIHDHGKGIAEGSQLPVVRERDFYHNDIGRSASSVAQRPAWLPASIAVAQADRSAPVAPVTGVQDLSKAIAALMAPEPPSGKRADPPVSPPDPPGRPRDPVGPPSRRADPPGRHDDPASRERERDRSRPAAPEVDIDRIVGTVQRRLAHQMTIERERRGMMR